MTNPQGPPNPDPIDSWGRPGNQGPFGQPPTERPTERIRGRAASGACPRQPPPGCPVPPPGADGAIRHAPSRTRSSPATRRRRPAGRPRRNRWPLHRKTGPSEEETALLRDPLSILLVFVIVLALVVAGLIGAELYVRHVARQQGRRGGRVRGQGPGHRVVRRDAADAVAGGHEALHQHLGADGRQPDS